MPFPSTGCQPCRSRRLKCDETQPVCQRCAKAQRTCHGAQQALFIVHTENPYASGQKKRPRGPRSIPKNEPASYLNVIPPRQPFNLHTEAVMYFVQCHLRRLDNAPSHFSTPDDLVPMRTSRPESQIIDLAISSLSLAVFSRSRHCPPAAAQAARKYQQLLQLLQLALTSLDHTKVESCLLAISYMSMYENSIYQPQLDIDIPVLMSLKSRPHDEGLLAILKYWKEHLSPRQHASAVIKYTRRAVMKHTLIRNGALPIWLKDGSYFGEHGLELEYDCILTRIISVRQRLSALLSYKTSLQPHPKELASLAGPLNREAQDIDIALREWAAHFPITWQYRRHSLPAHQSWSKKHFYSPTVYSCRNFAYAGVWLRYFSSRMLILSTRLRILQLIEGNSDSSFHEQHSECLIHKKAMADDLASAIPFCLERFGVADGPGSEDHSITLYTNAVSKPYIAALTLTPLAIASSISHVNTEQESWFKAQLVELGGVMGYGILEAGINDRWMEL